MALCFVAGLIVGLSSLTGRSRRPLKASISALLATSSAPPSQTSLALEWQVCYFVCNNGWPALMGVYPLGHRPMLSSNCFVIMYLWLRRINCLFLSLSVCLYWLNLNSNDLHGSRYLCGIKTIERMHSLLFF